MLGHVGWNKKRRLHIHFSINYDLFFPTKKRCGSVIFCNSCKFWLRSWNTSLTLWALAWNSSFAKTQASVERTAARPADVKRLERRWFRWQLKEARKANVFIIVFSTSLWLPQEQSVKRQERNQGPRFLFFKKHISQGPEDEKSIYHPALRVLDPSSGGRVSFFSSSQTFVFFTPP